MGAPNPVLRRELKDMFSLGDEGVKAAKPGKTRVRSLFHV
jgi:hypothetical protein